MEQQDGYSYKELGRIFVYNWFRDYDSKMFNLTFELRDFNKNYCIQIPLSEEMIMDLIKAYTEFKEAGFEYEQKELKYRKGKDER